MLTKYFWKFLHLNENPTGYYYHRNNNNNNKKLIEAPISWVETIKIFKYKFLASLDPKAICSGFVFEVFRQILIKFSGDPKPLFFPGYLKLTAYLPRNSYIKIQMFSVRIHE